MASMFPTGAGMASAAWNPSRFAAETSQTNSAADNPSVPGAGPSGGIGSAFKGVYLPILVLIVLLWALERRRLKRFVK
jgi:hypothetical protein